MAEPAQLLYLEPDDEITSVVRRLAEVGPGRVILVAPGRTRATSSAIGMRLLARRAAEAGREVALVADVAGRALATEAGIVAFPTIAAAQGSDGSAPAEAEAAPHPRAAIHVIRGERLGTPTLAGLAAGTAPPQQPPALPSPPMAASQRLEATQPVPVVTGRPAERVVRRASGRPAVRWTRTTLAAVIAGVLVVAGAVAAVLPAATVHLVPTLTPIGPVTYQVSLSGTAESGTLQSAKSGTATGTYDKSTPAHGTAYFANFNFQSVTVPAGTHVSAGDEVFTTDGAVTVPASRSDKRQGVASVSVTATQPGQAGNVAADAIDTVDDGDVRGQLCPFLFGCSGPIVANRQPTTGGTTKTGPQISQKDVDAVVAAIQKDLATQLAARLGADSSRIYAAAPADQVPTIDIPQGLVGTKDTTSFDLSGQLNYDRRYVMRDALTQAVITQLQADAATVPSGWMVIDSSLSVVPGELSADGSTVRGSVVVRAATTRQIDIDALKARILGRPRSDAESTLADLGRATIDLWPSWVDAVPRLGFRVTVSVETPSASSSPSSAP